MPWREWIKTSDHIISRALSWDLPQPQTLGASTAPPYTFPVVGEVQSSALWDEGPGLKSPFQINFSAQRRGTTGWRSRRHWSQDTQQQWDWPAGPEPGTRHSYSWGTWIVVWVCVVFIVQRQHSVFRNRSGDWYYKETYTIGGKKHTLAGLMQCKNPSKERAGERKVTPKLWC
jgi:hypothetical protein